MIKNIIFLYRTHFTIISRLSLVSLQRSATQNMKIFTFHYLWKYTYTSMFFNIPVKYLLDVKYFLRVIIWQTCFQIFLFVAIWWNKNGKINVRSVTSKQSFSVSVIFQANKRKQNWGKHLPCVTVPQFLITARNTITNVFSHSNPNIKKADRRQQNLQVIRSSYTNVYLRNCETFLLYYRGNVKETRYSVLEYRMYLLNYSINQLILPNI